MSKPTDKAERDRRRLTLNERMPTEQFCLRLMDQVDALDTERAERRLDLEDVCLQVNARNADVTRLETESRAFAADVLSLSASLGKKIERVSELEADIAFMRDEYSPVGARGCRLCVYENGVFQRACQLHREIAELEAERACPQCPHCHLKRGPS